MLFNTISKVVSEVVNSPIIIEASDVDMGNVKAVAQSWKKTKTLLEKLNDDQLGQIESASFVATMADLCSSIKTTLTRAQLKEVKKARMMLVRGLKKIVKYQKDLGVLRAPTKRACEDIIGTIGSKETFLDYYRFKKKEAPTGKTPEQQLKKPKTKKAIKPSPSPKMKAKKSTKAPPKPTVFREPDVPKDIVILVQTLNELIYGIDRLEYVLFMFSHRDRPVQYPGMKKDSSLTDWVRKNLPPFQSPGWRLKKSDVKKMEMPPDSLKNFDKKMKFLFGLANNLLGLQPEKADFRGKKTLFGHWKMGVKKIEKSLPVLKKASNIKKIEVFFQGKATQKTDSDKKVVTAIKNWWKKLKAPEGFKKTPLAIKKGKSWDGYPTADYTLELKSDDIHITFRPYENRGNWNYDKGAIFLFDGSVDFKTDKGWSSFDRPGIEDSFHSNDLKSPDPNAFVQEQIQRVTERLGVLQTMVDVPDIGYRITPKTKERYIQLLQQEK